MGLSCLLIPRDPGCKNTSISSVLRWSSALMEIDKLGMHTNRQSTYGPVTVDCQSIAA